MFSAGRDLINYMLNFKLYPLQCGLIFILDGDMFVIT